MQINVILMFILFSVGGLFAQEEIRTDKNGYWIPPGSHVSYGVTPTTIWRVGTASAKLEEGNKERDRPLNWGLFGQQAHPFTWQQKLDGRPGAVWADEYMWFIHGSSDALNAEINKFDPKGDSSFLWADAPQLPVTFYMDIRSSGQGRLKVFQGPQIIASMRVITSSNASIRLASGSYVIDFKDPDRDSTEFKGAKMGKVLHIVNKGPKDRGIFLHAGSLGSNSHGCYRISPAAIDWLYAKVDTSGVKPRISITSS
jgi:hypothetical protein